MQLLTPLALAGGLLALPVILLYMLRLRRQEIEVSSIMLWQQLLQDTEANTPWQRLRRNLLLLLQLLILAALVFALARPFITVPASGQRPDRAAAGCLGQHERGRRGRRYALSRGAAGGAGGGVCPGSRATA